MNAQEIISSGILELYCTGLTSPAETAEVAVWAKQYPEVAAEIEAIQSGLEAYAQTHAVAPAASVKGKVFEAINAGKANPVAEDKPTAKVYSISPAWKYAAAASILLLIGSMVFNYTYYSKYQKANSELASAIKDLEQEKNIAGSMKTDMEVMTDPNAMHVKLDPTKETADAPARIYWMQNTKEVYIDPSHLPVIPANKQYQFWAIVDGKPVNGGIITTTINGKTVHVQKMKSFGNAQAFAISVEDAGPEKPVPGDVVSMGKM